MDKLYVIKIGGALIDDEQELEKFLIQFSEIKANKILIHGGGKLANALAEKLNVPQQMVNGRRITDKATLDIVTMVYAGNINKNIVAKLQSDNCNAIGFSGADGNVIQATKRTHPEIDFGFVGDITKESINADLIERVVKLGLVPVFSAITHDHEGNLYNTNADTIAGTIAQALSHHFDTELLFCFDKNGVLENVEDENSTIKEMNKEEFESMKLAGKVHKGILPKLANAFAAKENNVQKVFLLHEEKLIHHITKGNEGTQITI